MTWKIAGINFDHFHMGDLLREAFDHPDAEIVAICDEQPARMAAAQKNFSIPDDRVFTDYRQCLETARPDVVILCPAAARHAEWTEKVAPYGVHILMEKPFAASLAEADRMVAAVAPHGRQLAINWPLRWYPSHATAHRILASGQLGQVLEVHSYGGNRGPLYHGADKVEREPTAAEKASSWFYHASEGGGSLLDYLGYGTTLGTWLNGGLIPDEVSCLTATTPGLEVDEHSITIARYGANLSKFETRWGTFTDPWTHQPQPRCGFTIRATDGTVSSFDNERYVRVQSRDSPQGKDIPVDTFPPHQSAAIAYFLHCLATETPVEGPLSPTIARIGQQIVDTAFASARERRALPLLS